MTYEQAKKDFVLFGVFVYRKNKKDKWVCVELDLEKENIPDDTEGKIGVYRPYQFGLSTEDRLCFIANKKEELKL